MTIVDPYVWQDREIRFDIPTNAAEQRAGEVLIDSLSTVEDTKGNNGEHGTLKATNLRMIWVENKNPRTNLSIGYNCIVSITIKTAQSKLRGNSQALYVLTKFNGTRFEFIFTNVVQTTPKLFTTVQAIHRAYETTKLYRDLKLRGAIIKNKELILLPQEQIYNKINGVWNLSSDQGNLGTFFLTNVRLVWHANLAENFNVSIPFLQMKTIRVRDSKFGLALVVETMPQSGAYVLGFRIDPVELLHQTTQEIQNIHQVYSTNPIFGISYAQDDKVPLTQLQAFRQQDSEGSEGADEGVEGDGWALYYADVNKAQDRPPHCHPDLGLAVEALPEGITLDMLWQCTN